jgi:hypothetical protein
LVAGGVWRGEAKDLRGTIHRGDDSNTIDSGVKDISVARGLKKGRALGQSQHQTSISVIVYLILAR